MEWCKQSVDTIIKALSQQGAAAEDFSELLRQACKIADGQSADKADLAQLTYQLGNRFLLQKDLRLAEKYWKQCQALTKDVYGKGHPYTASAAANLGNLYIKMEEDFIAATYFQQAADEIAQGEGEGTPFAIIVFRKLANLYRKLQKNGEATVYYTKAMVAIEQQEELSWGMLGDVCLNLAEIYAMVIDQGTEPLQYAVEFFGKAAEAFGHELDSKHQVFAYIQKQIFECKQRLGYSVVPQEAAYRF